MNTKRLLAILAISYSFVSAYSATRTWIGNTNTDWNTASNWSGNAVPTNSDDVVINNGSASNQPILDQDRTIASLTISAGSLDMDENELTVTGNVSLTGGSLTEGWLNAGNYTAMSNTTFNAGGTFLVLVKTAGGNNDLAGGNTFNGPIAFLNEDDSRFRLGVSNPDDFNGVMHFEERSSGALEPAYNGDNTFSSDISSNGSPNTVTFAAGNGAVVIDGSTSIYGSPRFNRLTVNTTGQINMQENQPISVLRVIAGTLDLDNNQITASQVYFTGGTVVDGIIVTADINAMQNTTFQGPLEIEKTGGSDNTVNGGNTFNLNDITLINSSSRRFRMANSTGDDFNNDITFVRDGSGAFEVAYRGNNTFAGDISTEGSNNPVQFGLSNGIVIIDGNTSQELIGDLSDIPTFRAFTMNTTGTLLTNNIPLYITQTLSLTNGIINSSETYPVIIIRNATVTGAKNSSHVNGTVNKIGDNAFTFPVGDGTFYSPISISAPSGTAAEFAATYNNFPYSNSTLGAGIDHISAQEHWILDRLQTTNSVNVTLSWNTARSGPVTYLPDLRVARFSGTQWVNQGNGGTTGNTSAGTVTTSSVVADFSPFTLGSSTTLNPLPISLLNFDAVPVSNFVKVSWTTTSELNNDYFLVQKSIDGINWSNIGNVKGAGNSEKLVKYNFNDMNPVNGVQFYRLQQFDINGEYEFTSVVAVRFNANTNNETVTVYPNPATGNTLNVNINSNEEGNATVSIINSLGQKVLEFNSLTGTAFTFDINDLASGIYTVQVSSEAGVVNTQLIKK